MTAKALSSYILTNKYANHVMSEKRRETWPEATERVFGMHRRKYALVPGVVDFITEAESASLDMLALGSMRVLQYAGMPIERKNSRGYNCVSSFIDRPRMFQEAFWLLLCGCGTGFSTQWHHVEKLPPVVRPSADWAVFVIPDTIEGWADALGALMSSYFQSDDTPFPQFRGKHVVFDYDLIRPEGSPLSSGSGKAPGPEPLRHSLDAIRKLLDRVCHQHAGPFSALEGGTAEEPLSFEAEALWASKKLQPIDAYDIVMHASDAVLAGGVRRSASIAIFSPTDVAMSKAKTGSWFGTNAQRARSNNSALLLRGETSREQFAELIKQARSWGEPGFYWSDSTEQMPNPCVEASFWPVDPESGQTGWQFCNLSIINMAKVRTKDQFRRAARAAAIMGTLQAGYTNFEYLGPVSERITRREALLGVSMTGMMEAPDLAFDPETLQEMAQIVLTTNAELAALLGIQPAARATLLKPEGTSSLMLETCSGIHPHHAKRYLRRVQANQHEAPARFFQELNPRAVEKSAWGRSGTDLVVSFCVDAPDGSTVAADVSSARLLSLVKLVKENWVDAGKRPEACTQPWLSHNVSNTIYVGDDEWEATEQYIFDNQHVFAGIALLSRTGDLDYQQAPFCEVLTAEEIVNKYGAGAMMASGLIVDGVRVFNNDLWVACDTAMGCPAGIGVNIKRQPEPDNSADAELLKDQREWARRAEQFAQRYFSGDMKAMAYCLKHVHNLKLWHDLNRETVDVDYTQMVEDVDGTNFSAEAACAGGSCAIV